MTPPEAKVPAGAAVTLVEPDVDVPVIAKTGLPRTVKDESSKDVAVIAVPDVGVVVATAVFADVTTTESNAPGWVVFPAMSARVTVTGAVLELDAVRATDVGLTDIVVGLPEVVKEKVTDSMMLVAALTFEP